jgi:hypothetical protein
MRNDLIEHIRFDAIVDPQYFAEHGFAFLEAVEKLRSTVNPEAIRRVTNYIGHSIFGQPGRMPSLWDRRGDDTVPLIMSAIYRHLRFKEPMFLTDEQLLAWRSICKVS